MPFARPTIEELDEQIRADIEARVKNSDGTPIGPVPTQSVLGGIARATAGLAYGGHSENEWLARQRFAATADGEELDAIGADAGVSRKAATYSGGSITITGADGLTVPAGSKLASAGGRLYETEADALIVGGTATTTVEALEAGEAGDLPGNSILSFASPIVGITSTATVTVAGLTGGADEQSDEDYRAAIMAHKADPPGAGTESDYVRWMKEVPEVTRAWALENHLGLGTVGATFVLDDNLGGIVPGAPKVAEVQAYLDARRPLGAAVTVFAPGTQAVAFTIELEPDTPTARASVTNALEELLNRETAPGGTLFLSHIRAAISNAAGEADHVLTVPAANVTPPAGTILTMGVITWV
jgi:uncharacterized phage protein gp47/JayE